MHGTKKLCDLYDNNEINIQSLKALGIESESFGNLLVLVDNSSYMMALKYCNARKRNVGRGFCFGELESVCFWSSCYCQNRPQVT